MTGYDSVIITGPTATGKTELSLKLAEALNGEIISCDSMQVYRGMDTGTAKATAQERARAPHHMIDILEPWEDFSVADYCKMSAACVEQIRAKGRLPIFVGGTGLYVTALKEGFSFPEEPEDRALRAELEEQASTDGGLSALYGFLLQNDPEAAASIHMNNKKRVIRAVELFRLTGLTRAERNARGNGGSVFVSPAVFAMDMERSELYRRIDARVDAMMAAGLIDEVRAVNARCREAGRTLSATAAQAIGYKELLDLPEGDPAALDAAVAEIKKASRHYAKRQLTWLRKWSWVTWVDALSDPLGTILSQLSEDTDNLS